MGKGRMEAFSDGVIAILITIMVLELKVPHGETLDALSRWCRCSSATCSVSSTWASTGTTIITCCTPAGASTGSVLWANLHLLFWLSLIPFHDRLDGREPLRRRCPRRSMAW